jgi:CRP-like cAMP-binding protein/RsiW-degrading membrane proteinase PrsW (M82 family)
MVVAFALLIALAVPVLFLVFLRRYDLYQTGKFKYNFATLIWGIAAYFLAAQINPAILNIGLADSWDQIVRFWAPIVEEILKSLIVIYLVSRADFNYIVDGAIYGFGVGIGFAAIENIQYMNSNLEIALIVAVARVFSTNLVHATGSGLIGAALANQRGDKSKRAPLFVVGGYVFAIFFHGLFNSMVSSGVAILVAVVYGFLGVGLTYYIIRHGMNIQKDWVSQKLGMTDRVTDEERKLVQNAETIEESLEPIAKRFGAEKVKSVRSLIYKQAEIGIKRKILDTETNANRKEELLQIIEDLSHEVKILRKQIGVYPMMMVREVYLGENTQVFQSLNARIASAGITQKGGGVWNTLSERMKEAELFANKQYVLKTVKETNFFKELSDEALNAVTEKATVKSFQHNEALMKKGDPADSFYVILKGSLKIVTTDAKGEEIIINKVNAGETIGELALIDELPRSAGAIALERVEALELTKEVFFKLLDERWDVAQGILRGFSTRLRFSTTYIEKVIDWSQKTAAGDYSFLENTQTVINSAGSDDQKAAQLLSTFYSMVRKVKEREEGLKQQLEILTFQIDQERRKKEFEEITSTDFYSKLKEQAQTLRKKRQGS